MLLLYNNINYDYTMYKRNSNTSYTYTLGCIHIEVYGIRYSVFAIGKLNMNNFYSAVLYTIIPAYTGFLISVLICHGIKKS